MLYNVTVIVIQQCNKLSSPKPRMESESSLSNLFWFTKELKDILYRNGSMSAADYVEAGRKDAQSVFLPD